jgi:FKBP-type peptidyl-prolyl cis-trans isomerases 2
MPLKDGDIVTLDYEGRTDGILFDTTLEKVAKKENALVENRKYAPITVVVGEGKISAWFEKD